ncbi:MAG: hypothetical protein ACUVXJ_16950 [Phycisphaerae bacterium]
MTGEVENSESFGRGGALAPAALLLAVVCGCAHAPVLLNPGFEMAGPDGTLPGWTILTNLDPHGYGPPAFDQRFDDVIPGQGRRGYRSDHCLSFPSEGAWNCPVFAHSNGDGKGINGKLLGKAAAFQTVNVSPGRYRLTAMLRTADGHLFSASFSLGVNIGLPAVYANDDSTGIRWTRHDLAMASDTLRGVRERGEWCRYESEPFTVVRAGPVTVWIRFNYTNENQFPTRWQVDDVAIEPFKAAADMVRPTAVKCPPVVEPLRMRVFCGDQDNFLADPAASVVVEAPEIRLFRKAREIPPGTRVTYCFPTPQMTAQLAILVCAAGPATVRVHNSSFELTFGAGGAPPQRPVTCEHLLPSNLAGVEETTVTVEPRDQAPVRLYEIELGRPSRTVCRLLRVQADAVAVPWVIGSWDASSAEFAEKLNQQSWPSSSTEHPAPLPVSNQSVAMESAATPSGRWELRFMHKPARGHHYYLVHGLIGGTSSLDVGGDGIIDWKSENKGEEIVDFDATHLLVPGMNTVMIDATGEYDFAAMVDVCPGATDMSRFQLAFEGDEHATRLTRVADNTWFWLREFHYEPNGFVDASVPKGHWYGQFWPVDIAFALREWIGWGRHEESVTIGRFMARYGWHGHPSNRSGGVDNTAGNILATQLCEIIRRCDYAPQVTDDIWKTVSAYADEVTARANEGPYGLIRGTNWENAGNHEHGPCYALSTTLGAAAGLRKAAVIAESLGNPTTAGQWRELAVKLRSATLKHLVLHQDHQCPTGFVLPKGTWAYGLRTDGTIEDQPLAGYFWAGGAPLEVDGFMPPADRELYDVYDRTLQIAVPLMERKARAVVSRYADSYDGPDALIAVAALCDRIDFLQPLLDGLSRDTDVVGDRGSEFAELSRWASGGPGGPEDTNLVCAAGFLYPLRILAGIDDLLTDGRQLSLFPRLPWNWTGLRVNSWPVRCRDADGRETWTHLTYRLDRSDWHCRIKVRTTHSLPGIHVRLGPFPTTGEALPLTVNGRPTHARPHVSGDATWLAVEVDVGPFDTIIEAGYPCNGCSANLPAPGARRPYGMTSSREGLPSRVSFTVPPRP